MTKQAFFEKLADSRPSVTHWGLPEQRLFPLDTAEHVKTAQMRFPGADYDVQVRLDLARNIATRAAELGVELNEKIAALTGDSLNPDFDSIITLRKQDSAHMRDPELDHLAKLAHEADGVEQLTKVAAALQAFDRDVDIEGNVSDPALAVFGRGVDPFAVKMPETTYDNVKLAGLRGQVSDAVVDHLEGGGSVADLPWTTREAVASYLRDT